jgi:hypothetical protein
MMKVAPWIRLFNVLARLLVPFVVSDFFWATLHDVFDDWVTKMHVDILAGVISLILLYRYWQRMIHIEQAEGRERGAQTGTRTDLEDRIQAP